MVEQLEAETGLPLIEIAAALAAIAQGTTPLLLAPRAEPANEPRAAPIRPADPPTARSAAPREREGGARSRGNGMETFRIEVGSTHGIKPSNVVGAIANEAGIEGVHIGRIDIREDHSFVDLPEGMPKQIFKLLQKVLIAGRELRISQAGGKPGGGAGPDRGAGRDTIAKASKSREGRARDSTTRPARKMLSRARPGPISGKKG